MMPERISPCRIRLQVVVLLLSLVAVGCDDSTGSPTDATGPTALSIFLKDGPGDVDIVWVQVDDVVLVGQGAPISLLDEPIDLINLTELVAVALVEGVLVEPGPYTQVRLVLGGAVLLDDDGIVYWLRRRGSPRGPRDHRRPRMPELQPEWHQGATPWRGDPGRG